MESLEAFRLYLLGIKGQKPSTVNTNLKLLRKLLYECYPLSLKNVQIFINNLLKEERDTLYINQYINVVKIYGDYKKNPELSSYPYLKRRHRDDYVRATLSDDELEAFLNLPNLAPIGSLYWERNNMWTIFWMISVYEGFRPGETVKLRKQDVDLGRNVFILNDTKTGHRLVPISFVIRESLTTYLQNLEGEYLFPPIRNYGNKYMKCQAWEDDFKKRIKRLTSEFPDLGRRQNLTPYSLRHTFGTRQADEDVSLFKIQKAMGHRNLATTEKYIHMSLKSVENMLDNDRLSRRHRNGFDLLSLCQEYISTIEKKYKEKLLVSVRKTKEGKKITFTLEVIG